MGGHDYVIELPLLMIMFLGLWEFMLMIMFLDLWEVMFMIMFLTYARSCL